MGSRNVFDDLGICTLGLRSIGDGYLSTLLHPYICLLHSLGGIGFACVRRIIYIYVLFYNSITAMRGAEIHVDSIFPFCRTLRVDSDAGVWALVYSK